MPLLPMALMAVGSGMEAYGQYFAGAMEKEMADFEAAEAEWNARAARRSAAREEKRFRRRAEGLKSGQRAFYGKAGVTLEGSPTAVLAETAELAELDALAIRLKGEYEAQNLLSQAALTRAGGRARRTAGVISAFGSLLGGGARVARMEH